jgi:predicted AlkP superfamily phosphohydrolase/phosphomutase
MRTVTIGLDGVSWNVLDPLLDSGQLPHIRALRDRSAHGVLESTIPFYTGPAWASYATACSPGAHGVYDFMMLRSDGELSAATHGDLRRGTYYEQLAREGKRSVIVNLPLDQGPAEGAVIVNSWLTPDEARRIFPLDRRERYREQIASYRNYPTTFHAPLRTHLEDLCALEASRFRLVRELFLHESWDHFFVLFSSTDWLAHMAAGQFIAGEEDARAAYAQLYRELDGYVGWLVEHAPDALVALISDHGQCEETHVVHVNAVLRELGLVRVLRDRPAQVNAELAGGRGPRSLIHVPQSLGGLRRLPALRSLARMAKRGLRAVNVDVLTPLRAQDVDRVLSRAFSPTIASYAIHTHGSSDEDLARIRGALADLRLDDGRPALAGVWSFEELYGVPPRAGAPTLVFAPSEGVRPSIGLEVPFVIRAPEQGRGAHQRDGIVVLAGPQVASGDLGRVTIYDIAPSLLAVSGAAIPTPSDGRVLYEAFSPGFAAGLDVRETNTAVESENVGSESSPEIEARLAALGYL